MTIDFAGPGIVMAIEMKNWEGAKERFVVRFADANDAERGRSFGRHSRRRELRSAARLIRVVDQEVVDQEMPFQPVLRHCIRDTPSDRFICLLHFVFSEHLACLLGFAAGPLLLRHNDGLHRLDNDQYSLKQDYFWT
jgi:hypothetical protein